jgi:hypothetical protein
MKRFICYAANEQGYIVQVFDGNSVIHEYAVGNNRYKQTTSPDGMLESKPNPVETLQTLKEYAKISALELAKEYLVHPIHVHYCTDILFSDAN